MWWSHRKPKLNLPYDPAVVFPHRTPSQHVTEMLVHESQWGQPRWPNREDTDAWTQNNLSAIKKNEVVLFAGKWMPLELIVLSKLNQARKDK